MLRLLFFIITLWCGAFVFLMRYPLVIQNPVWIVYVLLQMHLYTGLFITAHDAMHGTVSGNKKTNTAIGRLSLLLYAALPYNSILPKHHLHHKHVADPQPTPITMKEILYAGTCGLFFNTELVAVYYSRCCF